MKKIISWQQYSNSIATNKCWILIDGKVYDISDFLVEHPGGDDILRQLSGLDASKEFNSQNHSSYAKSLRDARHIGDIQSNQYPNNYLEEIQSKKNKINEPLKTNNNIELQIIKLSQLAKHRSQDDCWIAIDNQVYDVTQYLNDHPGGVAKIMNQAGTDCTSQFHAINHSFDGIRKKQKYKIGKLQKKSIHYYYPISIILLIALIGIFFILTKI